MALNTSPACTITGTLTDTAGNGIPATVKLLLVNYLMPPFVAASNVFSQLCISTTANSEGVFSLSFFGNYQISPSNTYYQLSWQIPGNSAFNENTIISGYVFNSAGTFDLSTLIPLSTPLTGGTVSLVPQYVEVPGGAINSENVTFTLQNIPIPSSSLSLYVNGIRQVLGTAYTLSLNVITFIGGYVPRSGASLVASYSYLI
jgi:hypothetical protein